MKYWLAELLLALEELVISFWMLVDDIFRRKK